MLSFSSNLRLLFLFCYLTIPLTHAYQDGECNIYSIFDPASSFLRNHDKLLSTIPTNAIKNDGFFNDTVGEFSDDQKVYGLAMCYYDTTTQSCATCLTELAEIITGICPICTDVFIWRDECFLRYANHSIFSILDTNTYALTLPAITNKISDPIFFQVVRDLMLNLSADVVKSPKLFAVGEAQYTTSIRVYGLAQCMRDLSANQCQQCIDSYARRYTNLTYYPQALRNRMFGLCCYMRYEFYLFYNPIVSPPEPQPVPLPESKNNIAVIIVVGVVVVIVVVAVVVVLAVVGVSFWRRSRPKTHRNNGDDGIVVPPENVETGLEYILTSKTEYQVFDLITLENATDNYSDMNKLGKGGFGPVYLGILPNGLEIAVKILSESSGQGIQEFKNEVNLLAKLKHKNLVQLLGCCIQKNKKMLCYEYLPNGSLDKFLFAKVPYKTIEFGWRVRFKIIEGISRGLHYLHEESILKIIHRDLKASNILLDKEMHPKISDFGIARFFEEDQTHVDTSVVAGTFGYMAPEYILHGNFSAKSDVYSFGILVLEIITGQKNSSFLGSGRVSNLTNHALQHWNNGTVSHLKDPILDNEYLDEIKRCVHIALLCVQGNPINRPDMETVKNMLRGNSKVTSNLPLNLSISTLDGFSFGNESYTINTMTSKSEGESSYTLSTTN